MARPRWRTGWPAPAQFLFNWSPARVPGRHGSALLGFMLAALLLAPATRPAAVFFVALSPAVLADAAWTIGRRLTTGRWPRTASTSTSACGPRPGARRRRWRGRGSALLTVLALAAWRTSSATLAWGTLRRARSCSA
jgi:UDP-N-acetylmuramyl pentapeptide phosphotransferase/UDP-N-acetylglucosamine-1-phosphate transferase